MTDIRQSVTVNSSIITEEYDVFADSDTPEEAPSTTDVDPVETESFNNQEPTEITENDTTTIDGEPQNAPVPEEEPQPTDTSSEQITTPTDPASAPSEEGVMAGESVNPETGSTIGGTGQTTSPVTGAAPIGAAAGVVGASTMSSTTETPKPPSTSDISKPQMPGDSKPDKDEEKDTPLSKPDVIPEDQPIEDTQTDEVNTTPEGEEIIETGTEYEQINEEAESLYDMEGTTE